jgi:hypothetical protein
MQYSRRGVAQLVLITNGRSEKRGGEVLMRVEVFPGGEWQVLRDERVGR